jgi:hypothetical protein
MFKWSAREGKGAPVALEIRFRRVNQGYPNELAGFELEAVWLLEFKRHCPLGHFLSIREPDLVRGHESPIDAQLALKSELAFELALEAAPLPLSASKPAVDPFFRPVQFRSLLAREN